MFNIISLGPIAHRLGIEKIAFRMAELWIHLLSPKVRLSLLSRFASRSAIRVRRSSPTEWKLHAMEVYARFVPSV